jgi:hypothetical protein
MFGRISLIEVIRNLFTFERNRTRNSLLLFLAGFAFLGALPNALFSVISFTNKWLLHRLYRTAVESPGVSLGISLFDFFVTLGFVGVILLIMLRFSPAPAARAAILEPPLPRRGLVLLVSVYRPRANSAFQKPDDIDFNQPAARLELFKSNWGPLAVAAEHHSPQLKHCWLLCSDGEDGSHKQALHAERVIRHFAGARVKCHIELTDANDVSKIANDVKALYDRAALRFNLAPDQVISDFTGGTAAMSCGVVLATVAAEHDVEYLRQDKPLVQNGVALTRSEILEKQVVVTVVRRRVAEQQ